MNPLLLLLAIMPGLIISFAVFRVDKYDGDDSDKSEDINPADYAAIQRPMVSSDFDITDYAAKEPKPAPRPPTAVRIIPRNPTRTTTSVAAAATAATVNYWQLDDDEAADGVRPSHGTGIDQKRRRAQGQSENDRADHRPHRPRHEHAIVTTAPLWPEHQGEDDQCRNSE